VRRVGSYFCYGILLVLWSRSWISNIKIRPWIEHCSFYWKMYATTTTTTTTTTIIIIIIIIKVWVRTLETSHTEIGFPKMNHA
jgi:hypothetical protein